MPEIIKGEVKSKARNGTGIRIGDKWYNGDAATIGSIERFAIVELYVGGAKGNEILEVKSNQAGSTVPPKPTGSPGGSYNRGESADSRQNSILFQSSRKDAVAVITSMLAAEVLPLPAKKDDKYDAVLALVDNLTVRYYKEAAAQASDGSLPVEGE